jgi:hypothetical protein
MEEKMTKVKQNLKATLDRKKSYEDKNTVFRYFKVVEHVFIKVKAKISLVKWGCFPNITTRYYGNFDILENIGVVSYMLALHTSMRVHNVFHVSLLMKYVPNPNHIIYWTVIQVEHKGDFQVEPVRILDQKVKVFKNKDIGLVKVQ